MAIKTINITAKLSIYMLSFTIFSYYLAILDLYKRFSLNPISSPSTGLAYEEPNQNIVPSISKHKLKNRFSTYYNNNLFNFTSNAMMTKEQFIFKITEINF